MYKYTAVADRVFSAACRNHSADVAHRTAARQVSAVHDDARHAVGRRHDCRAERQLSVSCAAASNQSPASCSALLCILSLLVPRSPVTHRMAPWVHRVFIELLPKVLCIERPKKEDEPSDNDDQTPTDVLTDVFQVPPDVEKYVGFCGKEYGTDFDIPGTNGAPGEHQCTIEHLVNDPLFYSVFRSVFSFSKLHNSTAPLTVRCGRLRWCRAVLWRAAATCTATAGRGRRSVQSDRQRGHEPDVLWRSQPHLREAAAARDGENDRSVAVCRPARAEQGQVRKCK